MKKISLLMVSMLLMGLLVGCSGGGDDKSGQKIQTGDYTSEPGGANKEKAGNEQKTEGTSAN